MYKATVKHVAMGKNEPTALYCKSKSGNVYKFRTPVPADRAATIIAKIKSAEVINTKHWIKLQEGKAPTTPVIKAPISLLQTAELIACEALAEERLDELKARLGEIESLSADLTACESLAEARLDEIELLEARLATLKAAYAELCPF